MAHRSSVGHGLMNAVVLRLHLLSTPPSAYISHHPPKEESIAIFLFLPKAGTPTVLRSITGCVISSQARSCASLVRDGSATKQTERN